MAHLGPVDPRCVPCWTYETCYQGYLPQSHSRDKPHCQFIHTWLGVVSHVRLCFSSAVYPWWRHLIETFSALLALCAGNSPVTGEFPAQRPVTRSFDVFFDLRLNKRLSKQSCGCWFDTSSRQLWRHCNAIDASQSLRNKADPFDWVAIKEI